MENARSSTGARALARMPGQLGGLLLVANLLLGLFTWSYFSPPFSLPVSGAVAFILTFLVDLYRRSSRDTIIEFHRDRAGSDPKGLAYRTLRRLMFHRHSGSQLATLILMIVLAGYILFSFGRALLESGSAPKPEALGVVAGALAYVVVAAGFALNRRRGA